MPEEFENIEIRSEEVQEILGTPPPWLVAWGTTIAAFTVIILFWVGHWVEYPDKVSADIRVTSTEPPKRLIAENYTYISKILVENEDTVETGEILMVFKSKASWEDVLVLQDYILSVREINDSTMLTFNPPDDLLLGDLQEDLYDFFKKQEDFRLSNTGNLEKMSIRQLRKRLYKLKSGISVEKKRKAKVAEQLTLVNQRYAREQNQFYNKEISLSKLRKTREDILALEREMQGIESLIKNKEFEEETIRGQINGVKRGSIESASVAYTKLKDSFVRLQNKVDDWEKRYLITSPTNGIALIPNENIGEQQFVSRETELMMVVPLKETETIGKMAMELNGSGKVKRGQQVIVRFDSYPFHEFGAVIGVVSRKGRLPNDEKIPIEVSFPNGLVTTTGKLIESEREMSGTAEIITMDKRFIDRIFESFRKVFS
jgi:hypothetical protein